MRSPKLSPKSVFLAVLIPKAVGESRPGFYIPGQPRWCPSHHHGIQESFGFRFLGPEETQIPRFFEIQQLFESTLHANMFVENQLGSNPCLNSLSNLSSF